MNNLHGISSRNVVVAMLLALLTNGCMNWSSDVGRYRKVLDTAQPSTRPSYSSDTPLTLLQALALANADNESIASSGEDYIQALAEKMRQAGTFLPSLALAPSYTLYDTTGSGAIVAGNSVVTSTHQATIPLEASATGSLSQASNLKAAGITVEQRKQQLLDERETILLQVVRSYYTVLKAERQAAVYESSLTSKSEKVRDQEARLKLGNVRPLDVAQTQADLAGVRASLTQSRTDAANARSALARLIGVVAIDGAAVDDYRVPSETGTLDRWQSQAMTQRQDLGAAARATESAHASLEAAIRHYFPSVTINFSYFLYQDPSNPQKWTGAISGNLPLFSAFSIEADIRKAWSVYRQSSLAESQTRRQVRDDIRESFQTLQGNHSRVADLTIQVEAAQRAYTLAERSYQLGTISNLDRLVQQDNLLSAQLTLISAQLDEKIDYLALLRSTGNLASLL